MNFLLITAAGEGSAKAVDVLKKRIDAGLYPLNENTKFRREIKAGDRIFFYLGATKAKKNFSSIQERGKSIAGSAVVDKKVPEFSISKEVRDSVHADPIYVHEFLVLQNVIVYPDAIPFESLASELSITKRSTDWRACLMGGAKKLEDDDVLVIEKFTQIH